MRRFFISIVLLSVLAFQHGTAQRMLGPDTLLYTLQDEIVVSAFRLPMSLADAAAPVDVIRGEGLRNAPSRSVSDALRYSPGASVRAYGAGGSLDLVSLRGLEAEYTVVLYNGVRLNTAQITTVDLDKVSLHDVQQIEVVRGGYSSLYGADALGGIVNIRTSDAVTQPYVSAAAGSFGYRRYEGGAGAQLGTLSLSAGAYYEEAQNDYPFKSITSADLTRARSNYTQKGVSLHGRIAGSDYSASLFAHAAATDAGTPGALTGIHQGFARQDDKTIVISAPVHYLASEKVTLSVIPSAMLAWQTYYDPKLSIGGEVLDALYRNAQYGLTFTADHNAGKRLALQYGTEVQTAILLSDEVSGSPERLSFGTWVTADWAVDDEKRLRILPALRGDVHNDMTGTLDAERLSPSLGVRYAALPQYMVVRARYAQGYRIPTFNQLYWAQGGNPDIRPEESSSIDGGIQLMYPGLPGASIDLGAFRHDITDKIVWRPGAGMYWTPLNIRDVESTGIEASLRYAVRTLQADVNAQWIRSRQVSEDFPGDAKYGKQLLYVPEYSGAARLHWQFLQSSAVAVAGNYSGKRYYTSTNDKYLEPFITWDAAVSQTVTFGGVDVLLKAEALNILDVSYEVTAFYPMPGRSFRLSITTQLH